MLLLFHMVSVVCGRAQTPPGSIRGVAYDADFDGPVAGATVSLLESTRQTATDRDGHFLLADVPPGSYTLVIVKDGFERKLVTGVTVMAGSMADVSARLRGEFSEMDELVVREPEPSGDTATESGLLNLRAGALTFQDSVGRDLMSKAGAGDAAAAVKLVVGTTVVDGKYASVRGLSDRYVGTAVNGLRVPSSDPKKRAVQLDIFPAGTIDSISVSKTFTPDLPGDYSGGGVNIRLNSLPAEPFFKVGFSREFNRTYHGTDRFVSYEGGGVDVWARQRGERDMPEGAIDMEDDKLTDSGLISSHDHIADDLHPHDTNYLAYDRITKAFAPAMGIKRIRMPEQYSVNVAAGGRKDMVSDFTLGGVVAFTYGHKYGMTESEDTDYSRPIEGNEQVTNLYVYGRETGTAETKYGMLVGVGVGREDVQKLSLTFMRARSGIDQASLRLEEYDPETALFWEQEQAILYSERSMDMLQLRGEHLLDHAISEGLGLRIEWFGAHHTAEQYEPDVRYFENVVVPTGEDYLFQPRPPGSSGASQDSSTRIWRRTREDNSQYGLNFTVPFERRFQPSLARPEAGSTKEVPGALKFGWLMDLTARTYSQNSFYYTYGNQYDPLYSGPVRADFPPGRAGTAEYNAARDAWLESADGLAYADAVSDASADRSGSYHVTNNPNALWTDTFTDPDNLGVGEYQNSMRWYVVPRFYDVSYQADQDLPAGYFMLDLPLTRRVKFMLGARVENTRMTAQPESDIEDLDPARAFQVAVRNPLVLPNGSNSYYYTIAGVPKEEAAVDLQESHLLRAAGLVLDLTPTMRLRLNYAQTIARPTFLELAPVITFDYIERVAYVGNNDLRISTVENHDLRWEWFRKDGQVFSASLFHKNLVDPIDRESFSYLGQDYVLAVNYPHGRVRGLELEMRTPLGAPPHLPGTFTLGANCTLINAEVDVPENVRYDLEQYTLGQQTRDMEGQPAFIANFNLTYEVGYGTSIAFFFNQRGDMLKTGAAIGEDGATPNVYSLGRETVDVSFQQKIGPRFTATFRIKNATDQVVEEVYRLPDGTDIPRRSYREGVSYSFGLGGAW